MINEREKVHYECNNCVNTKECEYYQIVLNTVDIFKDSPLNIHFPHCDNQKTPLFSAFEKIESGELEKQKSCEPFTNADMDKMMDILIKTSQEINRIEMGETDVL